MVGNGPSGICLSYLLSGNMPYYVGQSEDDMLHARLSVQPDQSLVEQDLEFLAEVGQIYVEPVLFEFHADFLRFK